jgi:hypothetical protein
MKYSQMRRKEMPMTVEWTLTQKGSTEDLARVTHTLRKITQTNGQNLKQALRPGMGKISGEVDLIKHHMKRKHRMNMSNIFHLIERQTVLERMMKLEERMFL